MLAIVWTCCTAISAGNMANGSGVAEGSHMGGTSTGILRAEEWAVKERKQSGVKYSLETAERFACVLSFNVSNIK